MKAAKGLVGDVFMLLAIVGLVGLAARPGSVLRSRVDDLAQRLIVRRFIASHWDLLSVGSARLDTARTSVVLVEFSDFECPFCRKSSSLIDSAVAAGKLTVEYRHLPLNIHPAADGAARSAVCSESYGKFRAMYKRLMTSSEWQRDSDWLREALAVGIRDTAKFEECLNSKATRSRVDGDIALAQRLHISSTPAFFSRRGFHLGAITADDLRQLMDQP